MVIKNLKPRIKTVINFCISWRYLIALIVFILCVALKLHGSSIAIYNNMFADAPTYNSESLILGRARDIRSDEYIVHTPYYMSQSYNNYGKTSHMMSLSGQDMIVGYNAPVLDITLLAKPFCWGYVLLGNEYGLSWYWCSKLILLILVSFELCMIVTEKNKKVSLLGTLLIAFAPAVQWWFVPHMVDVFFWGMALFVTGYHFFVGSGKKRLLISLLLSCSGITFVLALFPSLQIPVGLSMLGLLVACLLRDKKSITFKKRDCWLIVAVIGFALAVLGYTIYTSREAISALLHTVYPGSRAVLGGTGTLKTLFTDLTTFTLPFKAITYLNNCEVSNFIHFAPLCLMLYPAICKKLKRNRSLIVGNTLTAILCVMAVFMLIGFPALLAKLTGFSYINRMKIAYDLLATIFTIWNIYIIFKYPELFSRRRAVISLAIYTFLYICFVEKNELSYLPWARYLVIILGLLALGFCLCFRHQKLFFVGLTSLIIISGATVNPLARGVSALTSHPLEQKIRTISSEAPESYWLASGDEKLASLGIINGARVLNATNFYPDSEKWRLLDPEGEYDAIYNRYAHIITTIGSETTQISTDFPDRVTLDITCSEVAKKMPVTYIISAGQLDSHCDPYFREIYHDSESEYLIYERVN